MTLKMSVTLGIRTGQLDAAIAAERLIEAAFTAARQIEGIGWTYGVEIHRDYAKEDHQPADRTEET